MTRFCELRPQRSHPPDRIILRVPAATARHLTRLADHYVADCFRRESPPQVKELAVSLSLNRSDFSKLFNRVVGEQASNYLRQRQIECAKRLLADTDILMNAIAYRCGFGTRTTFFRAFKRVTGTTPLAYRTTARTHTTHAL